MKSADSGFVPAWWLPGPHAQTIVGRWLRSGHGVTTRRERLELADGDFLDLDWAVEAAGRRPCRSDSLVLILHGLEGSAASRYVLQMHRAASAAGLASVALNFRSCSGESNRLPRFYHSGESGDLTTVIRHLRQLDRSRPLAAVGFSLGGNVLLKQLGECGREDRDRDAADAAVALSVPFDLAAGVAKLERGISRVYQRYLLRKLRRKVRLKEATIDSRVDVAALLAARTFREFDEIGTAGLHGFAGADDYYRRSSSNQFLAHIRRPTLLIHAADDPFVPETAIPRDTVAASSWLQGLFPRCGGHVGFVGGLPWRPCFWAERTAAGFLAQILG